MKRSIFIAFIILAAVVGWIGSGQFSNNVVARDDDTETSTETETSYSQDTENNDNKDFTFSVETKVFTSSLNEARFIYPNCLAFFTNWSFFCLLTQFFDFIKDNKVNKKLFFSNFNIYDMYDI